MLTGCFFSVTTARNRRPIVFSPAISEWLLYLGGFQVGLILPDLNVTALWVIAGICKRHRREAKVTTVRRLFEFLILPFT